MLDIAVAMIYLHKSNVRHCDITSKNILVNQDWRIKVSDVGLSREIFEDDPLGSQTDKRLGYDCDIMYHLFFFVDVMKHLQDIEVDSTRGEEARLPKFVES